MTVLEGQTLLDIAIQELGDRERIFELMYLNQLALDQDLSAGMQIECPDYDLSKREIVKVFSNLSHRFASRDVVNISYASGLVTTNVEDLKEGIKILAGQTLLDIAIQELGDRERIFELMYLNQLALDQDLSAGLQIECPDYDLSKKEIVKVFSNAMHKPASSAETRIDNGGLNIAGEGIGYWIIEEDFRIN